ncbi:ABC transporter ATP-binding protein [Bombiscardovia nodaiensis]|uniref:ABC transporter ATP-binding protein n=1 Tax=Bombiscardovia nodaiensis TaxID=2932181 RepID=A0ABM8B9I5_9BIFI|nr:ABC transporter ATP-binding protein [Bombiscardovia nodaiensis]
MAYLELKHVSFAYPQGPSVLDDISMNFELGESVALIGQNGAGKTTTVKLMNGLLKPLTGTVSVDGASTAQLQTSQVAEKVGYVFQNPNDQIFQDSIRKEIAYGLVRNKVSKSLVDARVQAAAQLCGLADELDTHPYDLPFSVRKFVTIAAVLVMDPQVLILDEPTAGQDAPATERLGEIVQTAVGQGKTVITITHDMEFVTSQFKRAIVMAHRRVLLDAAVQQVFNDDAVLKEANLQRPYIAQLARQLGVPEALTVSDLLSHDMKGAPPANTRLE